MHLTDSGCAGAIIIHQQLEEAGEACLARLWLPPVDVVRHDLLVVRPNASRAMTLIQMRVSGKSPRTTIISAHTVVSWGVPGFRTKSIDAIVSSIWTVSPLATQISMAFFQTLSGVSFDVAAVRGPTRTTSAPQSRTMLCGTCPLMSIAGGGPVLLTRRDR
jgi:hypothetical protein